MNVSPKELQPPEIQQVSTTPSHSFILKKKERTPEEGSKAICRKALIAALGNTASELSTATIPRGEAKAEPSPLTPSTGEAEVLRLTFAQREIVDSGCISSRSDEEFGGPHTEDKRSPLRETQSYTSEPKADTRVSPKLMFSLPFLVLIVVNVL